MEEGMIIMIKEPVADPNLVIRTMGSGADDVAHMIATIKDFASPELWASYTKKMGDLVMVGMLDKRAGGRIEAEDNAAKENDLRPEVRSKPPRVLQRDHPAAARQHRRADAQVGHALLRASGEGAAVLQVGGGLEGHDVGQQGAEGRAAHRGQHHHAEGL